MATLPATHPTLLDLSKRLDENGSIAPIIEILDQNNEILDDAVWIEANGITGHKTTMRSGIPEPVFRKLYGGVQPTKSRTVQVNDSIGMLESYAEIDKALADLNGNTAAWRLSEEIPFIEGFNQKLSRYMFYGNESTEPEGFTGMAPRYNSLSAENKDNIITEVAGTAPDNSDNASIWLMVWGPNTVHMLYPKGSQAGLMVEDKGQVTIENATDYSGGAIAGGRYEAYRTHYRWDCGLSVRDWRYVVRIQINQEDLLGKDGSTGPQLIDLLAQAMEMVPNINAGRAAFYCNRKVRGFFRRQVMNKTVNSTLSIEQVTRANGARIHIPMFDGVPIRRCDQLTNTEAGIGA